jgi:outer membrane protein insertion porin family/translocation and assembly module TamA
VVLVAALGVPAAVSAQDVTCQPGDTEVSSLSFSGNRAFSSATLADGIVTTPSTFGRRVFKVFGTRRCLDREQFGPDAVRLRLFYRARGYVAATVDTVVSTLDSARVAITFIVREGTPVRVSDLIIDGADAVDDRAALLAGLAIRQGGPFDKYAIDEARDSLSRRLRNRGYPDAEVFVGYDTRAADQTASVRINVQPGPRTTIGPLRVVITPRPGEKQGLGEDAVRRVVGIADGDLYSEERLERAKRVLYQTEAYDQVAIRTDTGRTGGEGDTAARIGVTLDLAEGYMWSGRRGVGYGTLDCFRAMSELSQYNFAAGAARLDLRARVSKIGIGEPLAGAAGLCPQARSDPYSRDLNYYLGAAVTRSALAGEFTPTVALYSERRSEYKSFLRTTPMGTSLSLARTLGKITQVAGFSLEFGKTEAQPALLCAVFNACEAEDRESFTRAQRLGVAHFALTRETADRPVDPTRGGAFRLELRTAGEHTASDEGLEFHKLLLDGVVYRPMGGNFVLAARLRAGTVLGKGFSFTSSASYVPPHERLFAGGPTTVRGYSQNELGPAVYIASTYDTVRANGTPGGNPSNPADTVYFRARADQPGERTVPTGGNSMIVANLEARIRSPIFPADLQWTLFTDVGEVWNRGTRGGTLGFSALKWTPGAGVRVRTIIGFIRLDIAYNSYARPVGAAFFDQPEAAGGALLCVSPGNNLRVTTSAQGRLTQAEGGCVGSFSPPRSAAFIRRLTPSISIGQAF